MGESDRVDRKRVALVDPHPNPRVDPEVCGRYMADPDRGTDHYLVEGGHHPTVRCLDAEVDALA